MTSPPQQNETAQQDIGCPARPKRRALRALLKTVCILLALCLVLYFFVLPRWLEPNAQQWLEDRIGRPVSLSLSMGFLRSTVVIKNLRIGATGRDAPPLLSADRISIQANPMALVADRPPIRRIAISNAEIHLTRSAHGTLGFQDILDRLGGHTPPESPPTKEPLPPHSAAQTSAKRAAPLDGVSIDGLTVRFDDRTADTQSTAYLPLTGIKLTQEDHLLIRLSAPELAISGPAEATAVFEASATFDAKYRLISATADVLASISAAVIDCHRLEEWPNALTVRQGQLDLSAQYSAATGEIDLAGEVYANRLAAEDVGELISPRFRLTRAVYRRNNGHGHLSLDAEAGAEHATVRLRDSDAADIANGRLNVRIELNLPNAESPRAASIWGRASAERVMRGTIHVDSPTWNIDAIDFAVASDGNNDIREGRLRLSGGGSARQWIDQCDAFNPFTLKGLYARHDLVITFGMPASLPAQIPAIRVVEIDRFDVRAAGVNVSLYGRLFDLSSPGFRDVARHMGQHTYGTLRATIYKEDDGLFRYLQHRFQSNVGHFGAGNGSRVDIHVDRSRPGVTTDRIGLDARLYGDAAAFGPVAAEGRLDAHLSLLWDSREADRLLEAGITVRGDRIAFATSPDSPSIIVNDARLNSGLSIFHPARGESLPVATFHTNIRTGNHHAAMLGNVSGLRDSWQRSGGRLWPTLADRSNEAEVTVSVYRFDVGYLGNLNISTQRNAAVDQIDATLASLRKTQQPLCEAIRMALAERRRDVASRNGNYAAWASLLSGIEELFDTRFPASAGGLLERAGADGVIRGSARLSKHRGSSRIDTNASADFRDLSLTYNDQRLTPVPVPHRLQAFLAVETPEGAARPERLTAAGRVHLSDHPLAELTGQGAIGLTDGTMKIALSADNLHQVGPEARRYGWPSPEGACRLHIDWRDTELRIETDFDRLGFPTHNAQSTAPTDEPPNGTGGQRNQIDGRAFLSYRHDPSRPEVNIGFDSLRIVKAHRPMVSIGGGLRLTDYSFGSGHQALTAETQNLRFRAGRGPGLALGGGLRMEHAIDEAGHTLQVDFMDLLVREREPLWHFAGAIRITIPTTIAESTPIRAGFDELSLAIHSADATLSVDGNIMWDKHAMYAEHVLLSVSGSANGQVYVDRAVARDFIDIATDKADWEIRRAALALGAIGGNTDRMVRTILDTVRLGDSPSLNIVLRIAEFDTTPFFDPAASVNEKPGSIPAVEVLIRGRNALRENVSAGTFSLLRREIDLGSQRFAQRMTASIDIDIERLLTPHMDAGGVAIELAARDGILSVQRGFAATGSGWFDLEGTSVNLAHCGLDIQQPLYRLKTCPLRAMLVYEARNVPATDGLNSIAARQFPGLSFTGTYSGQEVMSFNLAPNLERYRRSGALAIDMGAFRRSVNGSGWTVLSNGMLIGQEEPDYISQIFPALSFSSYAFRRMRNDTYTVRGHVSNFIEFEGRIMDLYVHGATSPGFAISYVVGLDIGRNLRDDYLFVPGGRFPLMRYAGTIDSGGFAGSVEAVPMGTLLFHLIKTGLIDKTRQGILGGGFIRGAWRIVAWPLRRKPEINESDRLPPTLRERQPTKHESPPSTSVAIP